MNSGASEASGATHPRESANSRDTFADVMASVMFVRFFPSGMNRPGSRSEIRVPGGVSALTSRSALPPEMTAAGSCRCCRSPSHLSCWPCHRIGRRGFCGANGLNHWARGLRSCGRPVRHPPWAATWPRSRPARRADIPVAGQSREGSARCAGSSSSSPRRRGCRPARRGDGRRRHSSR